MAGLPAALAMTNTLSVDPALPALAADIPIHTVESYTSSARERERERDGGRVRWERERELLCCVCVSVSSGLSECVREKGEISMMKSTKVETFATLWV